MAGEKKISNKEKMKSKKGGTLTRENVDKLSLKEMPTDESDSTDSDQETNIE